MKSSKKQCTLPKAGDDKMDNPTFWNQKIEKRFFNEAMKNFASVEQLFYHLKNGYFAYILNSK